MRVTVVALVALMGVASCSSSDNGMTRAQADAATRVGAGDAAAILGATWTAGPPTGRLADATIAEQCGDPRAGLGIASDGMVTSGTSPVYSGDMQPGANPTSDGSVRTAVLAYDDDGSAQAAFEQLTVPAFEDCLVAAVSSYLDGDHPDAEPVPDPTADAFDTTRAPLSDQATLTQSTFDEGVLGGADNTHNIALFVARSGPFVVTALAASESQNGNPKKPATLARTLGTSALAQAKQSEPA